MTITREEMYAVMAEVTQHALREVDLDDEIATDWTLPCGARLSWSPIDYGDGDCTGDLGAHFHLWHGVPLRIVSVDQLRHLLAGLGVREGPATAGAEECNVGSLLSQVRELGSVLTGYAQCDALLRIECDGLWVAECGKFYGKGDTPEEACRAALREIRDRLGLEAAKMESRAAELRHLAEGAE